MKFCLYCGEEKSDGCFNSREHVIPKALEGNFNEHNPFILRNVCDTCNHTAGEHIDLPFGRSWFKSLDRGNNVSDYQKIDENTNIPLRYMGTVENVVSEGLVCDFWFGPAGDFVYHFHEPLPPNLKGLAVRTPRIYGDSIAPGFVFLFLKSDNPKWQRVTARAIRKHFKREEVHAPQFHELGENSWLKPIPRDRLLLSEQLWDLKEHKGAITIDINAEPRFMSKLALGVGELFLQDGFRYSESAETLRKAMWEKDFEERGKLGLLGVGFPDVKNKNDDLGEMLSWKYGHSVGLIAIQNLGVMLFSSFYGKQTSTIWLTKNREYCDAEFGDGRFYLMCPAQRKCLGPYRYVDYLFHNMRIKKIEELAEFEMTLDEIHREQPPKIIQENIEQVE